MNNRIISILYIIIVASSACKDTNTPRKPDNEINRPASQTLTAYTLDERLKEMDSLVLVFYKDPYGKDSLRYTRYYTQISLTGNFDTLRTQLTSTYLQQDLRNCRSEGKIWCFSKGKIFQTIYFSTKCEACCFTYLIRDGNFYYAALSNGFTDWLAANRSRSVELPNNAKESE